MILIYHTSMYRTRRGRKFQIQEAYRRLVAVTNGSQSERTDGPTNGWRQRSVVEVVVVIAVET